MTDCIKVEDKKQMNSSKPILTFEDVEEEKSYKDAILVVPETHYSPKDKVSHLTWNNRLSIGNDFGVITIKKSEHFGCIVHLDYEKIINSEDVITGAVLSDFDRSVYDAVVTIYAAGNQFFTTIDIWHVMSQNPKARLTEKMRDKIVKSMFHISRFWMTIVTDYTDKLFTWNSLNKNSTFKSETKFYKNLQSTYTGRLINFSVIGNLSFNVTYSINDEEVVEKKSIAQVWKILDTPILYKYAKAKGQVSAVPIKYLDTSKNKNNGTAIRRGSHTDELATFLSREIDTMKKTSKSKQPYNNTILLERIYKIDGIDDVQQDINSANKKKKRTRDKLAKILSRFQENEMIKGHRFHKKVIGKSSTFYSVEILI